MSLDRVQVQYYVSQSEHIKEFKQNQHQPLMGNTRHNQRMHHVVYLKYQVYPLYYHQSRQ